nr:cell death abnormality protein 1-like [Biomphalaria glabrata]
MYALVVVQWICLIVISFSTSDDFQCPAGFMPPGCIHECKDGYYGVNCLSACSSFCFNASCRPQSGECYHCQVGFQGPLCSEKCRHGYYGANCSQMCPPNCENGRCDPFTGYCLRCNDGYSGSKCEIVQRLQGGVAVAISESPEKANDHTILYISILVITITLPVCTVSLWVFLLKKRFKNMYYKRFLQREDSKIYTRNNDVPLFLEGSKKCFQNSPSTHKKKIHKHEFNSVGNKRGKSREKLSTQTSFVKDEEENGFKEIVHLLKKNSPVQLSQAANYSSNLFFKTPNPEAKLPENSSQTMQDHAPRLEDLQESQVKAQLKELANEAASAQLISRPVPSSAHEDLVKRTSENNVAPEVEVHYRSQNDPGVKAKHNSRKKIKVHSQGLRGAGKDQTAVTTPQWETSAVDTQKLTDKVEEKTPACNVDVTSGQLDQLPDNVYQETTQAKTPRKTFFKNWRAFFASLRRRYSPSDTSKTCQQSLATKQTDEQSALEAVGNPLKVKSVPNLTSKLHRSFSFPTIVSDYIKIKDKIQVQSAQSAPGIRPASSEARDSSPTSPHLCRPLCWTQLKSNLTRSSTYSPRCQLKVFNSSESREGGSEIRNYRRAVPPFDNYMGGVRTQEDQLYSREHPHILASSVSQLPEPGYFPLHPFCMPVEVSLHNAPLAYNVGGWPFASFLYASGLKSPSAPFSPYRFIRRPVLEDSLATLKPDDLISITAESSEDMVTCDSLSFHSDDTVLEDEIFESTAKQNDLSFNSQKYQTMKNYYKQNPETRPQLLSNANPKKELESSTQTGLTGAKGKIHVIMPAERNKGKHIQSQVSKVVQVHPAHVVSPSPDQSSGQHLNMKCAIASLHQQSCEQALPFDTSVKNRNFVRFREEYDTEENITTKRQYSPRENEACIQFYVENEEHSPTVISHRDVSEHELKDNVENKHEGLQDVTRPDGRHRAPARKNLKKSRENEFRTDENKPPKGLYHRQHPNLHNYNESQIGQRSPVNLLSPEKRVSGDQFSNRPRYYAHPKHNRGGESKKAWLRCQDTSSNRRQNIDTYEVCYGENNNYPSHCQGSSGTPSKREMTPPERFDCIGNKITNPNVRGFENSLDTCLVLEKHNYQPYTKTRHRSLVSQVTSEQNCKVRSSHQTEPSIDKKCTNQSKSSAVLFDTENDGHSKCALRQRPHDPPVVLINSENDGDFSCTAHQRTRINPPAVLINSENDGDFSCTAHQRTRINPPAVLINSENEDKFHCTPRQSACDLCQYPVQPHDGEKSYTNSLENIYDKSRCNLFYGCCEDQTCNAMNLSGHLQSETQAAQSNSPCRLLDPCKSKLKRSKLAIINRSDRESDSLLIKKILYSVPIKQNSPFCNSKDPMSPKSSVYKARLGTVKGNPIPNTSIEHTLLVLTRSPKKSSVIASPKMTTGLKCSHSRHNCSPNQTDILPKRPSGNVPPKRPSGNVPSPCESKRKRSPAIMLLLSRDKNNKRIVSPTVHYVLTSPNSIKCSSRRKSSHLNQSKCYQVGSSYPMPSLLENVIHSEDIYKNRQLLSDVPNQNSFPESQWKTQGCCSSCPMYLHHPKSGNDFHSAPLKLVVTDQGVNTHDLSARVDTSCQCDVPNPEVHTSCQCDVPDPEVDRTCFADRDFTFNGDTGPEERTEFVSIADESIEYFFDAMDYKQFESGTLPTESLSAAPVKDFSRTPAHSTNKCRTCEHVSSNVNKSQKHNTMCQLAVVPSKTPHKQAKLTKKGARSCECKTRCHREKRLAKDVAFRFASHGAMARNVHDVERTEMSFLSAARDETVYRRSVVRSQSKRHELRSRQKIDAQEFYPAEESTS